MATNKKALIDPGRGQNLPAIWCTDFRNLAGDVLYHGVALHRNRIYFWTLRCGSWWGHFEGVHQRCQEIGIRPTNSQSRNFSKEAKSLLDSFHFILSLLHSLYTFCLSFLQYFESGFPSAIFNANTDSRYTTKRYSFAYIGRRQNIRWPKKR